MGLRLRPRFGPLGVGVPTTLAPDLQNEPGADSAVRKPAFQGRASEHRCGDVLGRSRDHSKIQESRCS